MSVPLEWYAAVDAPKRGFSREDMKSQNRDFWISKMGNTVWDVSKYTVHFLEENRPKKCKGLISSELMNVFPLAWMLH